MRTTGLLSTAAARAGLKSAMRTIERCYDKRASKTRAPRVVGITMGVSADGVVRSVAALAGTLKKRSPALLTCVRSALHTARFAKRTKSSIVRFSIVLGSSTPIASIFGSARLGDRMAGSLGGLAGSSRRHRGIGGLSVRGTGRDGGGSGRATGIGTLVRRGSPRVYSRSLAVTGSLDKATIRRIIRRHLSEMTYCYQKVLTTQPKARGKLVARFVISASGRVSTAKITNSSFKGAARTEIGGCVTRSIKRWLFPRPKGGGVVVVSYPFVFRIREL